jgi:hypothetical protein
MDRLNKATQEKSKAQAHGTKEKAKMLFFNTLLDFYLGSYICILYMIIMLD